MDRQAMQRSWGLGRLLAALPGCGCGPETSEQDGGGSDAGAVDAGVVDAGVVDAGVVVPTCSSDNWCWQNPLPQGNHFRSTWGSGPSDVWAVGNGGTVVHWNGTSWSSATSGTTNWLVGVWGSGPGDLWAFGEFGTILHHGP